jgi:dTDP-4-dehydrorhamnose reductase
MRLLISGASGQLGGYLLRELSGSPWHVVAWSGARAGEAFGTALEPVALTDSDATARAFRTARPDVVIHAAAVASVAACHRDPQLARLVNVEGSALLAELCAATGARLILVSTDLVFDGVKGAYREDDAPAPLSHYGRTKAEAEQAVLRCPRGVVARLSLLFGPGLTGGASFFDEQLRALREGGPVVCFDDEWRTPLSLRVAARALVGLASSDHEGLVHVGGPERLSRVEMGRRLAARLGADPALVVSKSRLSVAAAEPRPRDTSLDSGLWRRTFPGQAWPAWDEALDELGLKR